ncbi:hypothetical protein llg_26820 [Luteolibacter sp. LG18]|nr:hypothetical protein llg_26820 [Luteolibacter sp. LG18]
MGFRGWDGEEAEEEEPAGDGVGDKAGAGIEEDSPGEAPLQGAVGGGAEGEETDEPEDGTGTPVEGDEPGGGEEKDEGHEVPEEQDEADEVGEIPAAAGEEEQAVVKQPEVMAEDVLPGAGVVGIDAPGEDFSGEGEEEGEPEEVAGVLEALVGEGWEGHGSESTKF